MPKDQTAAPQASTSAAQAPVGEGANPLKRNEACLTCRKRKIRCDAEKPACGTCLRSWRHKCAHLPKGHIPPPPPVCDYSEPPPRQTYPKPAKKKKDSAEDREKQENLEGRIKQLEDMLKLAVGAGVAAIGGASGQQQRQQQVETFPPGTSISPRTAHTIFGMPGLSNNPATQQMVGGLGALSLLPSNCAPAPPPPPPQSWSSTSPASAHIEQASTSSASGHYGVRDVTMDFTGVGDGGGLGGANITPPASMDSPDEYLTELLWPAWPKHLPSPGMMDHLAEVFLSAVPVVHSLLNRARLMSRLSLPPAHDSFPHPAVLHAMCAIASRYTAVVQVPAPVDSFKPQFARSAVDRLEELSVPTTDGLGPLREGQDDFGTVHARWAIHYFQSSLNNPGEWLSLTLAAALIGVYYHSAGMLVECWSWIGQAARLSIPLGLNTSGKTGTGPKLVPPPEDEIDSAERRNLWWLIFSMDTFSSTGSGWSGSLSLADISTILPTGLPGTTAPPSDVQNPYAPDLLIRTPNIHANGLGLSIKAVILVRKVNDFIRSMDIRGIKDLRQDSQFMLLDRAIVGFSESFPAHCRDPLKATDDLSDRAVDPDLFAAHCLWPTALLVLHGNQYDPFDKMNHSTQQVRGACNALLDRIFRLSATTLDSSQLNPFITFCFFMGGKSILRMVSAAIEVDDVVAVNRLKAEVDIFRSAIDQVGQRLPIGVRHSMMLSSIQSMIENRGSSAGVTCGSFLIPKQTSASCSQMRFSYAGGLASRVESSFARSVGVVGTDFACPSVMSVGSQESPVSFGESAGGR